MASPVYPSLPLIGEMYLLALAHSYFKNLLLEAPPSPSWSAHACLEDSWGHVYPRGSCPRISIRTLLRTN